VLRELTAWRELTAIEINVPRKHVVPDETLISLSQESPEDFAELKSTNLIYGKKLNKYGEQILEAVRKGCDIPKSECPELPHVPTNRDAIKRRVQEVKKFIISNSERFGVDPALIGTRSELEAMAEPRLPLNGDRHRILRGWRKEFMGKDHLIRLTGGQAIE